MTIKFTVLMDSIESINPKKDSSLAMLYAAQQRGWETYIMTQNDVYAKEGHAYGRLTRVTVSMDPTHWFDYGESEECCLSSLDVIIMRKDPPFDMEYIYTTYLLDLAERDGVLVVNKPQSLRDANEKFFTVYFPDCVPDTLISRDMARLKAFWQQHQDVIFKPLDGMGGRAIFRAEKNCPNTNVILETLTDYGQSFIIAQRYIPEITTTGDKRILLLDGEPVPFGLARIPQGDESRGNLAAGAQGVVVELTERDRYLCQQIGPTLREMGLLFTGIDVIGDYITEINVTSPTCIQEIAKVSGIDIADQLMSLVEKKRIKSSNSKGLDR